MPNKDYLTSARLVLKDGSVHELDLENADRIEIDTSDGTHWLRVAKAWYFPAKTMLEVITMTSGFFGQVIKPSVGNAVFIGVVPHIPKEDQA